MTRRQQGRIFCKLRKEKLRKPEAPWWSNELRDLERNTKRLKRRYERETEKLENSYFIEVLNCSRDNAHQRNFTHFLEVFKRRIPMPYNIIQVLLQLTCHLGSFGSFAFTFGVISSGTKYSSTSVSNFESIGAFLKATCL